MLISGDKGGAGKPGGTGAVPASRDEPGCAGLPGVPAVGRVRDDARRQLRQAHHRCAAVRGAPAQVGEAGQGAHVQVPWRSRHGLGLLRRGRRGLAPDAHGPTRAHIPQLRPLGEPTHAMHVQSLNLIVTFHFSR
jgi:hypothetical protein